MARQPSKQDLRKRLLKRRRPIQDPMIDFFARQGMNILCDGDACVIAGSVEELQEEDFSDLGPTGVHLVRIALLDL